jgi:hypothetical protein
VGGRHGHHIGPVAGGGRRRGGLDGGFMTLLRGCGGDGKERAAYQHEAEAFVRYGRGLVSAQQEGGEGEAGGLAVGK